MKPNTDYVTQLHNAARTGAKIELSLDTDDRVLARVTDGIYRQPASAIRELLANAYDADATQVVVMTDAPRYSEILVRDNGNGMSAKVLLNMIQHIGGSAKRTHVGQTLGVTDPDNPQLSPGHRRLIGKIGIGLFSVSQLTRQFTIITKPKDENYRYTAVVTLYRYSEEGMESGAKDARYKTGESVITSEEVGADEPHGTTILLGDLVARARKLLQGWDMWSALRNPESDAAGSVRRVVPAVHSGLIHDTTDKYEVAPCVPWTPEIPAEKRMALLSNTLINAAKDNELYAQIDVAFDYYYRMIWSLGLALPLPYLGGPPFDLPGRTPTKCFLLSNKSRTAQGSAVENQASELRTSAEVPVGKAASIDTPSEGADFCVEIDGLRLYRPIRYDLVPGTSRALQYPLLFVGSFNPDLSKFDKTQRGSQDFQFSGYFYWTPRVVPKEHNGVLVRVSGASGTLFDPMFLGYQIAEHRRLNQLVAEIFVSKGLEEALNIDRESFNTAHPHYQILLNWVHNALRQVFNKQKELESLLRKKRLQQIGEQSRSAVQRARDEELRRVLGEEGDTVRDVVFSDDAEVRTTAAMSGQRTFELTPVVIAPVIESRSKMTDKTGHRLLLNQERAAAVVQLLEAYDLLDDLSPGQQGELVRAIIRIFNTGE